MRRTKIALPAEEFQTVLVSPGAPAFRRGDFPLGPIAAGGAAINCEVQFCGGGSRGAFSRRHAIDMWDGGRKGYGTTLRVIS